MVIMQNEIEVANVLDSLLSTFI